MALTFATEISLSAAAQPQLGHEPNNQLWYYGLSTDSSIENSVANPDLGQYDDLTFEYSPAFLSLQAIQKLGVKALPGFGASMFYTPEYALYSVLVVPIHKESDADSAPEVALTITDYRVDFVITGDYECYRIEFIESVNTYEKITYTCTGYIILPGAGTYLVKCTGYSNEVSTFSQTYETNITV